MLEVSTGSSDVPKRTIRMPVRTDEELRLGFKVWLEPEDDQDEIATQILPGAGPRMPRTPRDTVLDALEAGAD